MNEFKFLEVMGKIDDELISEAEIHTTKQQKKLYLISKRNIYAFGSVAVAAVMALAVGLVLVDNCYFSQLPGNWAESPTAQPPKDSEQMQPVESIILEISEGEPGGSVKTEASNQDTGIEEMDGTVYPKPYAQKDTSASNPEETSSAVDHQTSYTPNEGRKSQTNVSHSEEKNPIIPPAKGYYSPFMKTVDITVDSFAEDELYHIDVRTAYGFYRQLEQNEYDVYGIPNKIDESDFGEFIGNIREVDDYDYHGNAAESQEPSLAGAEVYYYAPKGENKAFIIVKQSDQCSVFLADEINLSEGFQSGLSFFNVQRAEDIKSVEYQKLIPDEGKMILSEQNVITDSTAIKDFYELICQLKSEDYSDLPEFAATPRWYIEAWDKYKANPNAFVMEDYYIIITLKDGTVLHEILYQPYLANGYVESMQELTPEQNSALKNLLQ